MVKCGGSPSRSCVTDGAVRIESGNAVIRSGSLIICSRMTGIAIAIYSCVLSVDVAGSASHAEMCAGQREAGEIMIVSRIVPTRCLVTAGAIKAETRCGVVGIPSLLVIL